MIKISDKFSVSSDKYNWILHENYQGQDKGGNSKVQTRISYHANIDQVAKAIVEQTAKSIVAEPFIESLYDLTKAMESSTIFVNEFLNEVINEH